MAESQVTLLLRAINHGDEAAYSQLIPVIYEELRRLARSRLRRERPDHTLQPTDLVNEAYLRLIQGEPHWESRAHFFGAAAEAMRRVLVDHARKRLSKKRGGGAERITFQDLAVEAEDPDLDLLQLNDALAALGDVDARLSKVVHLRYFAGLSIEETADVLGVSSATVRRDWTYARAWLYEKMGGA